MTEINDSIAALLRAAVSRARQIAAEATDGPWVHDPDRSEHHRVGTADGRHWVAYTGRLAADPEAGLDADHIALWNPVVAAAALDLLDSIAGDMEVSGPDMPGYGWPEAAAFAQAITEQVNRANA